VRMKWYGPQATSRLEKKLGGNMERAGRELALRVRTAISTQGPPRSAPGQPPHIDTQVLIASYGHETDYANLGTRIGSDVPYSVYLEAGTPDMAARPHLVSTLLASANDLAHLIAKP
jgi:hypothetical protein